jgi:hypothetical protein
VPAATFLLRLKHIPIYAAKRDKVIIISGKGDPRCFNYVSLRGNLQIPAGSGNELSAVLQFGGGLLSVLYRKVYA